MTNSKPSAVSVFFKLIITLFIFQIGYHATAQKISLPIYTIKSADLKSLLIKGSRSKLTACILLKDEGFNATKKSAFKLYSFYKNRVGGGSRVYKNEAEAGLSNRYFDTAFVPFLISNSEIKMNVLNNLPDSSKIVGDIFYFVPHLIQMDSIKGTEYYLIFTIEYLDVKNKFSANIETKAFLATLTKVATLNPCPPARPADYR